MRASLAFFMRALRSSFSLRALCWSARDRWVEASSNGLEPAPPAAAAPPREPDPGPGCDAEPSPEDPEGATRRTPEVEGALPLDATADDEPELLEPDAAAVPRWLLAAPAPGRPDLPPLAPPAAAPDVRAFSTSSQCVRYGSGSFLSRGRPGCMRDSASNAIECFASVESSKLARGKNIRSLSVPGFLGSCNITRNRCLPSVERSWPYFGRGRFYDWQYSCKSYMGVRCQSLIVRPPAETSPLLLTTVPAPFCRCPRALRLRSGLLSELGACWAPDPDFAA